MPPMVDRAPVGHPSDTRSYGCPVIDINLDGGQNKRKRRQRRTPKKIEHRFWKPDPRIKGKCMGYAMGYTRSYLAGAS